jgi:hypothetical protein
MRWDNRVMSADEDRLEDQPEFGNGLMQQIQELWVGPELIRRGMDPLTPVAKGLIVFPAKGPNRVLLDDEAALVAYARAARPIEEGEQVTAADLTKVEHMRPAEVDPDAGWVAFANVGDGRMIAFDFRRNRARASGLLDLADDFLAAAQESLSASRPGPAIDNCFAAAELAAQAQMLVFDLGSGGHAARVRWMAGWAELGNVPGEHSECLSELREHRSAARYGAGKRHKDDTQISGWIATTLEMIELARRGAMGPERELEDPRPGAWYAGVRSGSQ